MIRMDSASLMTGPATLECQAGMYGMLLLRFTGTNDATDDSLATMANIGYISASYRDRPFMSVNADDLWQINEMDVGQMEYTSTASSSFGFSMLIYASRVGDGNVFDVRESDRLVIRLDNSGVAASDMATGNVELFGIPQDGAAMYLPEMFTVAPNIPANSHDRDKLAQDNIALLYILNTTNLDKVMIERDGELVINCLWADLIAFSNMDCRLENAFTAGARFHMQRSASQGEALSDNVVYELQAGSGGAANPRIVCVSYDFLPDVLKRSAEMTAARIGAKFDRKARLGKSRPITVAKALASRRSG